MPEDEQTKKPLNKGNMIAVGIILFAIIIVGIAYIADKPKLTINEDMLGTDINEGKVLYLYGGDTPIPPTTVDYTVKSNFGKPIRNVNYLVAVDRPDMIEFGSVSKNLSPSEVLRFQFVPEFQTKEFKGQLYIRANKSLKLQKGETRFVNILIHAD